MALREFAEKGFLGLAPFGLSKLFGGDDEESNLAGFKLPDYFEDPTFQKTHKFMGDFGMDILGGNIPDYYKAIGESGGKEFEDMLNLQKRDITQGITETAALTGRGRGGGVSAQVGEAVGEASTKARYADFLRSLGGKQFFFQQGRGITEGARGAGQNQENARNTFGINRSRMDLDFRSMLDEQEGAIGSAQGDMFGDLLNMAVKGGVGYATGGWAGAGMALFPELAEVFNKGKKPSTKAPKAPLGRVPNMN